MIDVMVDQNESAPQQQADIHLSRSQVSKRYYAEAARA